MITFNSINTIVDDILDIVRSNSTSESETISKIQIEMWVHQYRAFLLKQDLDKGRIVNPDYVQEIPVIGLTQVDYTEKGTIQTGAYRFKSIVKLPKTIDLHFGNGITFVGDLLNNEIQLIPEARSNWNKYKRYVNKAAYCYLNDGYLYIEGDQLLEYVKLRGVFEYPTELAALTNPLTKTIVYDPNGKYPVPANLIPTIRQLILDKEVKVMTAVPTDSTNDANNKVSANVKN